MSSPTDSGLYPTSSAWLGDMPEHWGVRRLKYIVDFCGGRTPPKSEEEFWGGDIPWVSPKDMKSGLIEDTEDHITEAAVRARATRIVPAGAVLLVVRSGILRHSIPVAIAGRRVTLNQDIKALIPKGNCEPRYLKYTIQGRQQALRLAWTKTGATVESVEHELLANTLFPVPPLDEQRAIADFLDEKTAAIDELIAKKERLIELIEERFRAALQRVITKGLDPSVAKADSKLPWLGEIPAHWELRRLKYVADFINGAAFKPTDWQSDGIPIIRIQNLNGGEDFNYSGEELPEKYHVRKGDLLFGWSGNRGTSFGPFLWSREGLHYLNQHIFRVTGFSVDKDWLYWALKEVTHEIEQRAHGIIGMVHITRPELDNTFVPVPPMNEQKAIAAHLQAVSGAMRTVIDKEVSIISRLREYRQTLISAAVTGQLDVRSRTARALDPTAPEPLEEVLT